jgi:hypothetical protein
MGLQRRAYRASSSSGSPRHAAGGLCLRNWHHRLDQRLGCASRRGSDATTGRAVGNCRTTVLFATTFGLRVRTRCVRPGFVIIVFTTSDDSSSRHAQRFPSGSPLSSFRYKPLTKNMLSRGPFPRNATTALFEAKPRQRYQRLKASDCAKCSMQPIGLEHRDRAQTFSRARPRGAGLAG